jgi:dihydroorotase
MAFSVGETITIPSPIDVHAHLREPGGETKETIESGTYAALIGGYQAVFDMPNNPNGMQTWSEERIDQKIDIAQHDAHTHIGFYAGVNLEEPALEEFSGMVTKAAGLKIYMGHTTGNVKEHDLEVARPSIDAWIEASKASGQNVSPPILLHAREGVGEETAEYIASQGYPVHWCHLSTNTEAQSAGQLASRYPELFTAGVTPHHLTMTDRDADFKYGWNGARMMPPLGKEVDGDALLSAFNRGQIQILETDHAPHTAEDKQRAEEENPEGHDGVDCTTCFGVSGIEFVLPVMMSLVQRNKLSMDRLVEGLYNEPARMLGIIATGRASTEIVIRPYEIGSDDRQGMSRNNPYVGWTAWGRVSKVTIDGNIKHDNGRYAQKGGNRILRAGAEV